MNRAPIYVHVRCSAGDVVDWPALSASFLDTAADRDNVTISLTMNPRRKPGYINVVIEPGIRMIMSRWDDALRSVLLQSPAVTAPGFEASEYIEAAQNIPPKRTRDAMVLQLEKNVASLSRHEPDGDGIHTLRSYPLFKVVNVRRGSTKLA